MTIWLTVIACLAIGVVIGVVFASRLNTSPSRIQELENQIRDLKEHHSSYQDSVSDHFSMTADLVQHMTESYKEVYQHLASGAQELCSNDVANKLLPAGSDAVFENSNTTDTTSGLIPPKDYAAKQNPRQVGALSEDFGLDKSKAVNDEDVSSQAGAS